MSKLSEFYAHKEAVSKDIELNDGRWDALEDKLIKEEIVPELLQQLKSTLRQVKTPMMINVSYDPKGVLSLSFTRNCIQASTMMSLENMQVDAENTAADETVEEESTEIADETDNMEGGIAEDIEKQSDDDSVVDVKPKRKNSQGFSVKFNDGTVIMRPLAKDTMIETLRRIGFSRVATFKKKMPSGYPLVGKLKRPIDGKNKYQEQIGAWYVYTNISNKDKVELLEMISEEFGLGLEIENQVI